LAAHQSTSAAW